MMRKINGKRIALLGFFFLVLIILVFIFFQSGGKEKIKPASLSPPPELEPESSEAEETRKIVLFYPAEEDAFLHPEERDIKAAPSLVDQAKQVIRELLQGSQMGYVSPFPLETKLRGLFVTKEGVAYVDFSKEILEKHLSGSSAEISTVYSAVNSLVHNFKAIKKVFILIEGQEKETLRGHINLSQPFLPQYDLIAQ